MTSIQPKAWVKTVGYQLPGGLSISQTKLAKLSVKLLTCHPQITTVNEKKVVWSNLDSYPLVATFIMVALVS